VSSNYLKLPRRKAKTISHFLALLGCAGLQIQGASPGFSAVSPKQIGNTSPKESKEKTKRQVIARPNLLKPEVGAKIELPAAFRSNPESIADLQLIEHHIQQLVDKVSPAVVAVEIGNGSGSGVIISADGLVLTAGHVCGEPNLNVRFTFPNGKIVRGKTIGIGSENDTGLMRITDSGPWPHVEPGEVESARNGDWVLALGHPGGFDLRRSLVVRLGRIIRLSPDLQTDCTISPGDSGGPLFDMYGRVIGIHSFISTAMADNFHVPITAFYNEWDTMANTDKIFVQERLSGSMGVNVVDESPGCRLTVIDKGSPAFKAGLKVGDVVLKVEGRDILAAASFRRMITESSPGEMLNLNIRRGMKSMSFNVKLEEGKKAEDPFEQ
jgi:serine protease Do